MTKSTKDWRRSTRPTNTFQKISSKEAEFAFTVKLKELTNVLCGLNAEFPMAKRK